MAVNKLTDRQIKNAKPGEKTIKLSDGAGLQLWVQPTGGKLWRLAYRFAGKQHMLSLGRYPDVSLEAAREAMSAARRKLASGLDPALARKKNMAATFDSMADEFLEKQVRDQRAVATIEKNRWVLSLARPRLGPRPIAEISAAEVLAVLQELEAKGVLETARRTRAILGAVFRFAIATARAENDPTQALRGAVSSPTVTHRSAITDPVEFGGLLRAIWGFQGQATTRVALMLAAYLAPRPGELRHAEWEEFDLEGRRWTVPAGRMKMRRAHEVPLPEQAVALLRDLRQISRGRLLFPSIRDREKPISENTLNAALRRMGFTSEEVSAHGFRATFSTLANESGKWSSDAIERHLAHAEPNSVRRAYARGTYWAERMKLATWWADEVDRLRQGGRILPFVAVGGG